MTTRRFVFVWTFRFRGQRRLPRRGIISERKQGGIMAADDGVSAEKRRFYRVHTLAGVDFWDTSFGTGTVYTEPTVVRNTVTDWSPFRDLPAGCIMRRRRSNRLGSRDPQLYNVGGVVTIPSLQTPAPFFFSKSYFDV